MSEAEPEPAPFVCDVCGRFQRGWAMSNKSDGNKLVCADCAFNPDAPVAGKAE